MFVAEAIDAGIITFPAVLAWTGVGARLTLAQDVAPLCAVAEELVIAVAVSNAGNARVEVLVA
jgi:hypothetical protein